MYGYFVIYLCLYLAYFSIYDGEIERLCMQPNSTVAQAWTLPISQKILEFLERATVLAQYYSMKIRHCLIVQ